MTEEEIQNLANQLEIIKSLMRFYNYSKKDYMELGYDVEFKLDGEGRTLYIKQIRCFND